jgi:hypothetical protein
MIYCNQKIIRPGISLPIEKIREENLKVLEASYSLAQILDGIHKKKYPLDRESIANALLHTCSCERNAALHQHSCLINFSVMDVIGIRQTFCYKQSDPETRLNESEIYEKLIHYLRAHKSPLKRASGMPSIADSMHSSLIE